MRRKAVLLTLPLMLVHSLGALAQTPPEPVPPSPVPAAPAQSEEKLTAKPVAPDQVLTPPVRRGGSDYKVGRQDLLEIKVFDLEELNQTVRVADDGSITVPLLGRLQVAGLTKGELEALLARLLEERFVRDPQVTIFVKEYESKKVAVSGAVKKPGTYEMLGEKTLLEMISQAGGLDAEPGKQIYIFRQANDGGEAERLAVDLDRLVYRADAALNVALAPGDIVYVPAIEKVRIFVSGAVRNPNLYEVPRDEPVTVLKAVTLAGGTTDRAAEKKVQVIRTKPDGTRLIIPVDLKRVKRGKIEDPVLQRDDLVLVPEAFF